MENKIVLLKKRFFMTSRIIRQIIKRLTHLPSGKDKFKYIFNALHLAVAKKKRSLKQPYPNSVMLEITNLCQLHCKTCAREYSFGKAMDKGNMDFNKAKEFIDKYHIYLDKIALTGLGEPFLYPHLVDLIDYIRSKNKGILIFLSTNAMHKKTKQILDNISYKIDTLQISMDGCEDTFQNIRKDSQYSLFTENVKIISEFSTKHRFHAKINMVVFEENYTQMKNVISFAKEHGIREVCINSLNQVAIDPGISDYDFYDSDKFRKELSLAADHADKSGISLECPNLNRKNSFGNCPYPWGNYAITWDGFLVPCCAKPFPKELNFGNVFSDNLEHCINHQKLITFRKLAKRNITPEFCKNCHHVQKETKTHRSRTNMSFI